jgi:halocyanin-like protein
MQPNRRHFIKLGGLAAIGSLAGCSSNGNGDGTITGGENGNGNGGTQTTTVPEMQMSFGGWLSDTSNFEGTVLDRRGQSEVIIDVGASANSGSFGFAPPAVQVDTGTTVVWEWTGEGGAHNVVGQNVDFRSGDPTDEAGTTFSQTFEGDRTVLYYCNPHQSMGMKGAIVVGAGGSVGGGDTSQYDWEAATWDSYWYSLYNMSTNIAMSANGVLFPHNEQQREQFTQRIQGITAAADVEKPPIENPNLNMAPFKDGDPHFTQAPVFDSGDGRPDASTLTWDDAGTSGVVTPQSVAWTHLKGVTWAKNFQAHFDLLPQEIAPKFRAQVLTTLAQIGTNATLIAGGPDGNGALTAGDDSLQLVSGFRPADGTVVDDTARPNHHASMLWFLSDLVSLATNGWFGYVNPEPLIPANRIQQLADGMARTTMNAFSPSDIVEVKSTRSLGLVLGGVAWYGTHAGSDDLATMATDYANALADELETHLQGNGRVANGADNQAATQGVVGQGLLWAGQLDGFDRAVVAEDVLGYMHDELWDADAGTFASGIDDDIYTITARDAGDVTGGLNADDAVLGRDEVKERYTTYFDQTFNAGGLQRAQRPSSVDDSENPMPPLPPNAGGEFGQAAVYNAAIEYDTGSSEWSVADDSFDTEGALYLANQDIWIGQWGGDFYQGRGVPGESDTPPN